MNLNDNFTLEDLINQEREMFFDGVEKYGEYFINALETNELLNNGIKSILKPEHFIFILFLGQIKKHITLSLFSTVRQHHIQTGMNLRQCLEAISWAIYAMGNKEEEKFGVRNEIGYLSIPDSLGKSRNEWINANFPENSQTIKKLKDSINSSVAHSNIVYTFTSFDISEIEQGVFGLPFFDNYDDYMIKVDLWLVSNITLLFLNLLFDANKKFNIVKLNDGFISKFCDLGNQNEKLKQELMKDPRFIEANIK